MIETDILIIGAGPTGLGAAWQLDAHGCDDWMLCEADDVAGGLAGSLVDDHGFTWDFGGHVQFSHYDYFDRLMDELLGPEGWLTHDRESWVRLKGRFVPYPFQSNIHRLSDEDVVAAVQGLIHAVRAPRRRPAHFGEWIDQTFGPGLAELFMRPYNTKVWAREPEHMSSNWVGERVAVVDLPRIVENLRLNRDDVSWGPNNQFRFPRRGGTGSIWRTLSARLVERHGARLMFNRRLQRLDAGRHEAQFSDGGIVRYKRLVSTMALDVLIANSDLAESLGEHARRLEYSTTHVVGIGLHGAPDEEIARKCWMYFPEGTVPFYRVTHFSRYSPQNVPQPGQQWSLMAEVAESARRPLGQRDVVGHTIEGLVATGLIASTTAVHHTWYRRLERGYPVPSLGRDAALAVLLPALEQRDVFSRGRFGAWKYEVSNQDHSFAQGVEVIQRLTVGGSEETLNAPDLVNNRPRNGALARAS